MVAIIALIVLGPERLPKAAKTLGIWIAKAKRSFYAIKEEIDRELEVQELKRKVAEQQAQIEQANPLNTIHQQLSTQQTQIDQADRQQSDTDVSQSSTSQHSDKQNDGH